MEGNIPWIILSFLLFMNICEGKSNCTINARCKQVGYPSIQRVDMSGQTVRPSPYKCGAVVNYQAFFLFGSLS